MVAPSCCLEYRPTIYFWLILFFVVFPCLYITGRVITCAIEIVFRIVWTVIQFLYWDSEEDDSKLIEYEAEMRSVRSNKRRDKPLEKQSMRLGAKQIKASSTQTDQSINCHIRYIKKIQPSDNSDSLISDDEISQTTNGTTPHEIYNSNLKQTKNRSTHNILCEM